MASIRRLARSHASKYCHQILDASMKSLSEKLRFLVTGIFGASLELALFLFISASGIFYIYSHVIAFTIAVLSTFFLHFFFTYQRHAERENQLRAAFFMYLLLMYMLLLVGSAILFGLVELLETSPALAKLLQMVVLIPLSYATQKYKIFR